MLQAGLQLHYFTFKNKYFKDSSERQEVFLVNFEVSSALRVLHV